MENPNKNEESYFSSYNYCSIHEDMIKDSTRTRAYYRAILGNKHLFQNKIVLDVGCGTGILSLFAADAGAKHVYSVERSEMAKKAQMIVDLNGYSDRITVIHSKIEEATLPVNKVDIIISEWMGYCLLFESMLDSIIFARDKWLNAKGYLFPDFATIYIIGIEDDQFREDTIDWWRNVYGYDMSPMRSLALSEPSVEYVDKRSIVTYPEVVHNFDLYKVQLDEIEKIDEYVTLTGIKRDFLHGFAVYFEVQFTACHKPIILSTSPESKHTHWKQTIFYIDTPIKVFKKEDILINFKSKRPENNRRQIEFEISIVDTKTRHLLQSGGYYLL